MRDTATAAHVTGGLDLGDRRIRACALDEIGRVCREARMVTP